MFIFKKVTSLYENTAYAVFIKYLIQRNFGLKTEKKLTHLHSKSNSTTQ